MFHYGHKKRTATYVALTLTTIFVIWAFVTFLTGVNKQIKLLDSLNKISVKSSPETYVSDHDAQNALKRMAKIIHEPLQPSCEVVPFGADGGANYGRHDICRREYTTPCLVLTYGVQQEYTFELDIRKKFGCTVFALDPTVNYNAEIADGVYFIKWGAPSQATAEWLGPQDGWISVSPVALSKLVATELPIPILKMDCEGCEYKLYEHIVQLEPNFFQRVDQLAIEIHLSKNLGMATDHDALMWGKTLVLLERAGHKLQDVSIGSCAAVDEATGTAQLMAETGYANKEDQKPGDRGHCHNYLFARVG
jgi:hypothetical protein